MNPYWTPVTRRLTPYVPGEQPKRSKLIKLNTNENPYGPSPLALTAIREATTADLRRYPDPNGEALKAAIASFHTADGIQPQQVFVGNGSDEVLAHVFQALLQHTCEGHAVPLRFPDISYSFYPVYCGLYGIPPAPTPLNESFSINLADYTQPASGNIIFPNPNAPTGKLLPLEAIHALASARRDAVVVVDEAYIDFAGDAIPSAISLVNQHPNLLVVQTFSKSRSLAGLRVGFAIGHPELIEALERVKNSFNSYPLDRLALAGATAAMSDRNHFDTTRKAVMASRETLTDALIALGFDVLPSAANFLFARHTTADAAHLAESLRAQDIIVRHFKSPRIDQFLRITIGTPEECDALVRALKQILGTH